MLKKRVILSLTFLDGVLFRTKNFIPDYRYTKEFVNLWNIDELILIDVSETKFQKNFLKIIQYFSKNCFVPITVAGGIKSLIDAKYYFDNGADKIVCNTLNVDNNLFIKEISDVYGNQSIIHSIDFKSLNNNKIELFYSSGKKKSKKNIFDFIKNLNYKNFGEIILNDVSRDGGMLGFNINSINLLIKEIKSPVIAVGGGGNWSHFLDLFEQTDISAVCTQNIYHFAEESIRSLKNFLTEKNINIRK